MQDLLWKASFELIQQPDPVSVSSINKTSPDFLPTMQLESQVKFCGPQNISGASQQNRFAAFS